MKLFGHKHLKIIEQITIVVFIAVVAPMSVSGFIINNVNQQAVRSQLKETAVLTANIVSDEINFFSQTINTSLAQVSDSLKYIPKSERKKYLNNVAKTFDNCEKIEKVKNKNEY